MHLWASEGGDAQPKRNFEKSPGLNFLYFCVMQLHQSYKSKDFFSICHRYPLLILILLPFFATNWFCSFSSKEPGNKELALLYTDTLQLYLDKTVSSLTYTLEELSERKAEIDSNIPDLNKQSKTTADPKFNILFDQYKMLSKKYGSILPRYKEVVILTEDRVIKVKSMVKAINEGFYEGRYDFFKKEYSALLAETAQTYMVATELSEELKTLDPMYLRLEKELTE